MTTQPGLLEMPARFNWRKRWLLAMFAVLVLLGLAIPLLPYTNLLPATLRQPNPPSFSAARGRDDRWRQDLAYLIQELPRLHVDAFHAIGKSEFALRASLLRAQIPMLTDTEVVLRLMTLVARIGDGHTTLNFTPFYQGDSPWRLYPLSLAWLEDGWYVVGAQATNKMLLGAELNAIGGTPVDDAFARIAPLVSADNKVQQRTTGAALLLTAEVLAALDVVAEAEGAPFAFTLLDGEQMTVTLEPVVAEQLQLQPLQPQTPLTGQPLAAQYPERWYWVASLPQYKMLYFQYDVCAEMADYPFADFNADLFEVVDGEGLTRIIVDLRSNGGGNSAILQPFLAELAERPELEVYVLIGRRTFSSALMNAIELDQQADAVLVGEATGGRPNHYGEVRTFQLPNSKMQISYATKYFRMLPDADPLSLEPEIEAPVTIANQLAAYDAALTAALTDATPE